jgi:glycosyltransferase involved in cell wall biosynthesis
VLTPLKGQHVLLDAVGRLARTDVVVELMGGTLPSDASYEAELRRRAARPDLLGRVKFLGHVADPLARMRGWTVAVSASVEPESGPLSALEAMSIGVPVVATGHGGVVEVLHDAGLLVAPDDAAALAGALQRLLHDDALRRRCRDAGPRLVVGQQLTVADHQRRVLEQLDRVLRLRVPVSVDPAGTGDSRTRREPGRAARRLA